MKNEGDSNTPKLPAGFPVVLGLVVFVWHALTLGGGLFWLDAGDFVTASCDLGVAHPTGFPLYTLVGKAFCEIPLGSAAFRLALFSAAVSGVLSGLLVAVARRLTSESNGVFIPAAIVCLVVLWSTDVAALFARTPDVYAVHAALLLVTVLLSLSLAKRWLLSKWLLLSLTVGWGLSNHMEFALLAVVVVGFAALQGFRAGKPGFRIGVGFVGLVMGVTTGLLSYLYLPLAAMRGGYHVWGHPDTVQRFVDHVTGRSIRLAFDESVLSFDLDRVGHALSELTRQVLWDFSGLLALAVVGIFVLVARWRSAAVLLFLLILVDVFYAVVINPMGLVDLQNGAVTYCIIALFCAVGTASILARLSNALSGQPRFVKATVVWVGAVSLTTAAVLGATPERQLLNDNWGAEDLTHLAFQAAPTGSLVLTASESLAASQLYLVGVGALRPDCQALNRTELADSLTLFDRSVQGPFPLADEAEVARWPSWGLGAREATYHERISTVLAYALEHQRTVLWGGGAARDSANRWEQIELGFPLHRIHVESPSEQRRTPGLAELMPMAELVPSDPWGRRWMANYLTFVGTYYYHLADFDQAQMAFVAARTLQPNWASPLINLGVLRARAGDFVQALDLMSEATELAPFNLNAWLNLSRYHCVLDDPEQARHALDVAIEVGLEGERVLQAEAFLEQCP